MMCIFLVDVCIKITGNKKQSIQRKEDIKHTNKHITCIKVMYSEMYAIIIIMQSYFDFG